MSRHITAEERKIILGAQVFEFVPNKAETETEAEEAEEAEEKEEKLKKQKKLKKLKKKES